MNNFFKNRTWDDYLAMVVIGIIVLGLILFFVGFYFGFDVDVNGIYSQKMSVSKVLKTNDALILNFLQIDPNVNYNLFTLAGVVNPSIGALYGLVITSLLGFSLIMLGVSIVLIVILVGFTYDMIHKAKQKKNK